MLPGHCVSPVGRGITDTVVGDRLAVVGGEQILPLRVGVGVGAYYAAVYLFRQNVAFIFSILRYDVFVNTEKCCRGSYTLCQSRCLVDCVYHIQSSCVDYTRDELTRGCIGVGGRGEDIEG